MDDRVLDTNYFECHFTQEKVSQVFKNVVLLKKEQRSSNGIWILNFIVEDNIKIFFCSDRGYLDVYVYINEQIQDFLLDFPNFSLLKTNKENIDSIVEYISKKVKERISYNKLDT